MIILSFSSLAPGGVVHDVSTSLLVDGKIRSAVSEDRLTGIKHFEGYPSMSVKYCLEEANIRLSDVDRIVVGYGLLKNQMKSYDNSVFSSSFDDPRFRKTAIEEKNPKFYNHEYIHAKTGYFFSGYNKALVISLDGGGVDNGMTVSGGIYVIDKGGTDVVTLFPPKGSLGWVFGGFTELCGFRMLDGEGKTMSYATFGEKYLDEDKKSIYGKISSIFPKYKNAEYIDGGIDPPNWKILHNSSFAQFSDQRLISLLYDHEKDLIAWGAQKVLEDTVISIVTDAVEKTGIKNVVLTGGIFFNMIANMRLKHKLDELNCSCFFNPVCGDMGNAIGCAIEEYFQDTGRFDGFDWPSMYLGPEYDENQIISAIKKSNHTYSKVDKTSTAVDLLDKGKIVGWFQGRTEFGPRGLGNRSILAKTDDIKYKDQINDKVKHREGWRPFCPSITVEKSDYYLENNSYAPYMILGFSMKHTDEVPAVTHIDNTTRPQTLRKQDNVDFYNVINGMGGIVLNTSLNLAGDPINSSPTEALLTFRNSDMDALILGDYLIER